MVPKGTSNGRWKFREVGDDQIARPAGCGEDHLTEFLQAAIDNSYLTVRAHKAEVKRVANGLEIFEFGASTYFAKRRGELQSSQPGERLDRAFPFLMATYQSLHAALTLTFSSQLTEAAKPLRGAVETALYAYLFDRDPKMLELWTNRPTAATLSNDRSGERRKLRVKAGRELGTIRTLKVLAGEDAKLAELVATLHEELIDIGGHFNIPVLTTHTRYTYSHLTNRARVDYRLIGATARERTAGLKLLQRTISCALRVLQAVYRPYWEASGVTQRLNTFTKSVK